MSDRLAELSDDAAHEIRTALTESREGVLIAQKRIDSLRKSPLVVNGTRASLETLRGKLGEAEELYITLFSQVNANYGDERATREPLEAGPEFPRGNGDGIGHGAQDGA